jgi:hypothetical protein
MALAGLPQALNPEAKAYLQEAKRQHPGISTASEIAGGMGAGMFLPGGIAANAAQGGLTGWNMSEAANTGDRAGDAIFSGAVGAAAAKYGPHALRVMSEVGGDVVGGLGKSGGAAMQKLAKLLGFEPPPMDYGGAPPAPKPAPKAPPGGEYLAKPESVAASAQDVMGDVAAANPRPVGPQPARQAPQVDMGPIPPNDPYARYAMEVNEQGPSNISPEAWQPVPQEKFDQAALERIIAQQEAAKEARRAAQFSEAPTQTQFRRPTEPVTKNARVGATDFPDPVSRVDLPPTGTDFPDPVSRIEPFPEPVTQRKLYPVPDPPQWPPVPMDESTPLWDDTFARIAMPMGETPNASPLAGMADPGMESGSLLRDPSQKGKGGLDALIELAQLDAKQGGKIMSAAPDAPAVDPLAAKKQAIIDAQKQNPEALAAFGVDPKNGQRGAIDMKLLAKLAGIAPAIPMAMAHPVETALGAAGAYAIGKGAKASAPYMYSAGKGLENISSRMKAAASNPHTLISLVREGGALGGAATAILQALQTGDTKTVRAQSILLEMNPEFRARFAQDTGEQDLSAPSAIAR